MYAKTICFLLVIACCLPAQAQRYRVLIHEIMADPQPAQGLPDAEFIELKNTSTAPINLAGWRLLAGTAVSAPFPSLVLQPDSLVVITGRSNAALFSGNVIGISSFPALPNAGGILALMSASGAVVHAVRYESGWYQNPAKAQGGWTLEMIDARNPCGGANWKAATDPSGGTPGRPNSVAATNPDDTPPQLLSVVAISPTRLQVQLNEPLDSVTATSSTAYTLTPTVSVSRAEAVPPLFDQVVLELGAPLQAGMVYTLTASGIRDCAGNTIGVNNKAPAGLPQVPVPGDVVINELLFNPKSDGSDYVELYNRSNKIIDAAKLWLTNYNGSGGLNELQQVSARPMYLFPDTYLVLTQDRDAVLRSYLVQTPNALQELAGLPSLPDDNGSLVLLNGEGLVIDELLYSDKWHFPLLADPEGVALERIDPEKATKEQDNWASAAATAGFGTPTYRNSQYKKIIGTNATVSISPTVFSPDNDGFDDFCTLSFALAEPNFVANVFLFDAAGRRVRHLVQNQTLTQTGSWRWDGLDNDRRALPSGTYVVLVELFNLQGKKQQFKKTVTIARRN